MTHPNPDQTPPPTAPNYDPYASPSNQNPYSSESDNNNIDQFANNRNDEYLTSDEILARRLQKEEEEAAAALASDRLLASQNSSSRSQQHQQYQQGIPTTPNRDSPAEVMRAATVAAIPVELADREGGDIMTDEEMARKIEREMNDEIYARQLQEYERCRQLQATSAVTTRSTTDIVRIQQNRQQAARSGCSRRRWCSAAVMLTIVAGASVLVLFYGSSIWDRLGAGAGAIPPFFSFDEPENIESESFKIWRGTNGKGGLELTVVNAMTSDWYQYFNVAVADWNEAPALLLKVETATADPDCRSIPGKLKCCNNKYGKLGWSGLNEAWLDNKGTITASTAKMNESYLEGKRYAEKRYVTCHEIGHGFGLPHRDVSVTNPNLGTCLDYTTIYNSNVSPDETDFLNLENLYGTVDRRRSMLRVDDKSKNSAKTKVEKKLSSDPAGQPRSVSSDPHIHHVSKQRSYKDGRLLYKSDKKEIYEEKLPDGGRIISTLLLAK